MIRILKYHEAGELIRKKTARLAEAEQIVAPMLDRIRAEGDSAVLDYARKFDRFEGESFRIAAPSAIAALSGLSRISRRRRRFGAQYPASTPQSQIARRIDERVIPDGRRLGQIVRPLDSMGAYIPAGRYPLPSTLLMTVIPAQVAGVERICVASPNPSAEILGLCARFHVTEVYRLGGAQAIGAFAYGTQTIPRVERIVGPGNIYVAAAKKLIAGETGIDFIAGPTEIVIIAAEADPAHVAADLLAQAEHDTDASAILLTTSGNAGPRGRRRGRSPARDAADRRRSPANRDREE